MTVVIGLCGSKGSGKDHFFKVIQKAFPLQKVRKIAYADPIKNEILNIFNLKNEDQYDSFKRTVVSCILSSTASQHNVSGRHVVREIGMLMRRYDENQFTKYVEDQINKEPDALWCITDLRFENELKSIRTNLQGIVIKVKRPGFEYDGHVTETEIADGLCDSIILNDGSLQRYEERVMEHMLGILQTLSHN